MKTGMIEGSHGFSRVLRALGERGQVGAARATSAVAERHGCAGARSVGGVGGHVGAPHDI
jgi:hypothetical protein